MPFDRVGGQGMSDGQLVFRNGVQVVDPIRDALLFLEKDYSYRAYDTLPVAVDNMVTTEDIRSANHLGGRVSAAQQAELYARAPCVRGSARRHPS